MRGVPLGALRLKAAWRSSGARGSTSPLNSMTFIVFIVSGAYEEQRKP